MKYNSTVIRRGTRDGNLMNMFLDQREFSLDENQYKDFINLLGEPPKPTKELRKLLLAKDTRVGDHPCISFDDFHKAAEARLGRPVFTHEFARQDLLIAEYEAREAALDAQEKIDARGSLSPRAKLGAIVLLSMGLWAAIWLAVSGLAEIWQ